MGQTVSLGQCISGGSVVLVMNTRGNLERYDFPVVTAEVMLKYPDHLVVHCPRTASNEEQKFNIMLPDQPLLPGQPYMLYRIPEKHKEKLAESKSFSMVKRQIEATSRGEVASAAPEKKKGRRYALKLMVTRLHLVTLAASKLGIKVEGEEQEQRKLLRESGEQHEQKRKTPPQPLEMPCHHWRPNLASIPESPLGFHSIPQTPRAHDWPSVDENDEYRTSWMLMPTKALSLFRKKTSAKG
ncbi:hypothetical protein R1sor_026014 [Riccia sorocarpa]|uniref:Uncharacterized protein n=1 Tax=Riccia sorocarpa TaxID=122646 RepID=A0ABD3GBR1_9MARC